MLRLKDVLFFTILFDLLVGAWSVSDEQFEQLTDVLRQQGSIIAQLTDKNNKLEATVEMQGLAIHQLQETLKDVTLKQDFAQNVTIEERVGLLEIQVADLDEDISFLFDEQVIQDERLLNLEEETEEIDDEVNEINDQIEGLQVATLELDLRVTTLEENGGGGGGNSSVTELEERVEILEGTAADHETDITNLESISGDHETRLTSGEENIEGLLSTDVLFDERITALEEGGNGGGGSYQNRTIAFDAVLTEYDIILVGSTVLFNEVFVNEGDGYDSSTGTFTVPSGGDGFYYFSNDLSLNINEYGYFDMHLNGLSICRTFGVGSNDDSWVHMSCSAVRYLEEGDEVKVIYDAGTDTTPLRESSSDMFNVFSGFRI